MKKNEDLLILQHYLNLAITQFASSVSHELNNPLTFMLASAEELQTRLQKLHSEKFPVSQELKILSHLYIGTERVLKLSRQLRDLVACRTDLTYKNSEWVPTRVNQVIQNTLDRIGQMAADHHVSIKTTLAENVPAASLNPTLIEIAMMSLLQDSIEVITKDHLVKNPSIEIKTSHDGATKAILVSISDNGPKIGDEFKQKLFKPSFRSVETERGGNLNLSVCASIVYQHHGKITLTSDEQNRNVFQVTLPISAPHSTA